MSAGVERPIVLPLSNPTERIEAMPADVIAWSKGKAVAVAVARAAADDGVATVEHEDLVQAVHAAAGLTAPSQTET